MSGSRLADLEAADDSRARKLLAVGFAVASSLLFLASGDFSAADNGAATMVAGVEAYEGDASGAGWINGW